jgi:dipeptidyl aminopeptidase/acylaminoacyl peptidase
VIVAALTGAEGAGRTGALYAVDPAGGARVRLTDPEVCEIAHPLTSMASGVFALPGTAISLRPIRGAVEIVAVATDGPGDHWTLLGGRQQVTCVDANASGIVAAVHSGRGPGEVLMLPGEDVPRARNGAVAGSARPGRLPLDEDAGQEAPDADLSPEPGDAAMELLPLAAKAPDGEVVEGWLAVPRDSAVPPPLVVWLHGGPGAQAGWLLPPDARGLVENGLACLYLNPRGSVGRGEAFARALLGRLGEIDRDDVLAVLELARRTGRIDETRIGVHGVSYGGYLAAMLWSGHEVFRAAVVERAITSWPMHRAISDLGIAFSDAYWNGGPPPGQWPDPMGAPLLNRSPVLIVAGEDDRRCPVAESRLFFTRLYEAGVPAELAVLSGTGHGVGAAPPSVRRGRAELLRDWWTRQLGPGPAADGPPAAG